MKTQQRLTGVLLGAVLGSLGINSLKADNIAPLGRGILGYTAAVDSSPGTLLFNAGTAAAINDGDPGTHVDDFSAGAD